jgi:hypothetical protein
VIRIDPPRCRAQVCRPAYESDPYTRVASTAVNEQHLRLVDGAEPVIKLPEDARAAAAQRVVRRQTFLEMFDAAARALDQNLFTVVKVHPYPRREFTVVEPRLKNIALQRLARQIGQQEPDLEPFAEQEISERTTAHWCSDADEAASAVFLGEVRRPPPPEPERPKPSVEYVAACKLVISACYAQSITLHAVDPLRPDAPPTAMLSARASGPGDVDSQVARIQAGYLLAWAPTGRRLMAPKIEIVGFEWRELEGGTGVVLAPVESQPKAAKGGAK